MGKIENKKKTVGKVTFSAPVALLATLDELRGMVPRSAFIRHLIEKEVTKNNNKRGQNDE